MRRLGSKGLLWIAAPLLASACRTPPPEPSSPRSGIEGDVFHLASAALEGRAAGSAGGDSAATFIARRYGRLGLPGVMPPALCLPGRSCGPSYFQVFDVDGIPAENVVAGVEGSDPALRGRYVVVGAHYDHLGRSTERALDRYRGGAMRPGADDNASGTAALLELARRLSGEPAPASVLFAHFDAEEMGLVGSAHWTDHPPVPLDSIVLMINLDMVGRLEDRDLIVDVTAPAGPFESMVDSLGMALDLPLRHSRQIASRSDHSSFATRRVPAIALSTGLHSDYHRATDTPEKLDYAGMARIVDLAEALVRTASDRPIARR